MNALTTSPTPTASSTCAPAGSPTSMPPAADLATTGTPPMLAFRRPSALERVFNRLFGYLVRLGVGPTHNEVLEVPGRRTGKLHSTPVNVMQFGDSRYLVCPRGRAQWVRNADARDGRVTLRRGRRRTEVTLRALPVAQRAPILREYLDRYGSVVQRYFTVGAGAELPAFAAIAQHHPVFIIDGPGPAHSSDV